MHDAHDDICRLSYNGEHLRHRSLEGIAEVLALQECSICA